MVHWPLYCYCICTLHQPDTQNVVESSYASLARRTVTQLQLYGQHVVWAQRVVRVVRSNLYNLYITRYFPA